MKEVLGHHRDASLVSDQLAEGCANKYRWCHREWCNITAVGRCGSWTWLYQREFLFLTCGKYFVWLYRVVKYSISAMDASDVALTLGGGFCITRVDDNVLSTFCGDWMTPFFFGGGCMALVRGYSVLESFISNYALIGATLRKRLFKTVVATIMWSPSERSYFLVRMVEFVRTSSDISIMEVPLQQALLPWFGQTKRQFGSCNNQDYNCYYNYVLCVWDQLHVFLLSCLLL
jgi:hypothetical protein